MSVERLRYVLDSFALFAYFGAEPGEGQVRDVLTRARANQAIAYFSIINYGELIYVTERERGTTAARRVIAAVDQLPIVVVEADRQLTFAAAHVKARHALSYADAFAVALAQEMDAILLTGDPEFRQVGHLIAIEWLG